MPQPSNVLMALVTEMDRQKEIHPTRPRHPFHWHVVLTEEHLEAMTEIARLAQEQAESSDVDSRLSAARRLRVELIQVAAVALSWAETLPNGKEETHG